MLPLSIKYISITFQVADSEIDEMFSYADADQDGRINWSEFQTMINPPKPPPEQLQTQPTQTRKRVTIKTPEHCSKQTKENTEIEAEEQNIMENKERSDSEDAEKKDDKTPEVKSTSHIDEETEAATKTVKTEIGDDNLTPEERKPDVPDERNG